MSTRWFLQLTLIFKRGDIDTLREICCEGLLSSFRARINARHAGGRPHQLEWTLHKYNRFARVVSNRATSFPMPNSGLRQAIVRISSRQSLTRYDADGNVVPGTGEPKDVTEYLVIQKRCFGGKEENWEVWGTTEETTGTS